MPISLVVCLLVTACTGSSGPTPSKTRSLHPGPPAGSRGMLGEIVFQTPAPQSAAPLASVTSVMSPTGDSVQRLDFVSGQSIPVGGEIGASVDHIGFTVGLRLVLSVSSGTGGEEYVVAFSDQGGVLASLNLQASCSVPVTGVDENVLEQAGAYENRIMSLHQGQPLPPLGALSTAVAGAFGSLFENCL